MPLSKIQLKAGVNKEGTRYSTEGGWNDSDKVRFRKGLPEKIGGWQRISANTFLGIARSIHSWRTLANKLYIGIGTHLKFYIESGGAYNDITPLRKATATLAANPLITFDSSTTVRVIDTTGGYRDGDFVTFAGTVTTTNGVETADLQNKEFQISYDSSQQATATLNGNSSDATPVLDNNVGTIAIGMTVTGTGVDEGIYVKTVTDQNNIELSATPSSTLNDGDTLTFAYTHSYTITIDSASGSSPAASPAGGSSITATYQINTGDEIEIAQQGWGGGIWSGGVYSTGLTSVSNIRVWSQANFGEDLILNARGGPLYYWDGANNLTTRAVELKDKDGAVTANKHNDSGSSTTTLVVNDNSGTIQVGMIVTGTGISAGTRIVTVTDQENLVMSKAANISNDVALTFTYDIPTKANKVLVSDISRFVFCFGTTEYLDDSGVIDPLLVRWSDQENATQWSPSALNQAGSLRLSRGGEIITAAQARQEVLVWTDSALYTMQYVGYPDVWTAQIMGENISLAGPNATAYANGISFWMGKDKFYSYDGNVKPIVCTLLRHVFNDINHNQLQQIVAGTNEGHNEVWWFYPSESSEENDRYIIYNYLENIWYHGKDIKRTAWEDSGIRDYPIAATTTKNIVNHEYGVDNNETSTPSPVTASITSSEFDLQDGHQFAFVWRMIPDVTFDGSEAGNPSVTLTLNPLDSSGSGFNDPTSEGGSNSGTVTRTQEPTTLLVEAFTTQINTRLRGRQMSFKIESDTTGTKWQLGYPRIDMRPDGRR